MKRWLIFIILQLVIVAIVLLSVYQHDEHVNLVKTPPKVLAQWYKPENKRQVWLHTMFGLRRELQAIRFYAEQKDSEHLQKWFTDFEKHYGKVAEMVPQWRKKLAYDDLQQLEEHIQNNNFEQINEVAQALQNNCDSCHQDYQAVVALTYRAPDFSKITLDSPLSYQEHMHLLTTQVNQIKISATDGNTDLALASLTSLKEQMNILGGTCIDCHRSGKQYPSDPVIQTMSSLENSLVNGSVKEQGRDLGTLAVLACAQCHGTHRLSFGVKQQLTEQTSWLELFKHN